MSKHDFHPDEFHARRDRVRMAMRNSALDWLVLFHPVSIHWLTGSDAKSYQEFQCLLVSAEPGPWVVLTREGERNEYEMDALVDQVFTFGGGENEDPVTAFEKLAETHGLLRARVGMEVPAYYLHPHHYLRLRQLLGSALVAEPSNLVHDLKLVKSATELAYIRAASRKADAAMAAFTAALSPGRSELALAGTIMASLLSNDSGIAASPINLVSGERSGFSHGAPTERRLRAGDFGNVEFGATHRRYTATIGRQFSIGSPTARMRELYEVVRRACDACMAAIRDGVPATEPHAAAREVIGQAGMEPFRVHTSGYGLAPGFPPTWGEPLHLLADSTYTLRAGMVLSVEPPVFIGQEQLGARLIDNVLVTRDGAELLSSCSRDLIVINA
jgi:Xaa-Pro dipeptidase